MPSFTQEDLDRTARETEAHVRREMQAQQTAEFTAATELANRLQRERRLERIAAQITAWKAAGLLLPAEEAGLAEFMVALESGGAEAFEFMAAGAPQGAAKDKKTPGEFFAQFVAARGPLVKLGAQGGADADPGAAAAGLDLTDARAIAAAAQEFQAAEEKAGRVIAIDVAVAHVVRNAGKKA